MRCPHCGSERTTFHCMTKKGFERYKCLDGCGTFSERTGSLFFRIRFPGRVILLAVLLCLFMRCEHVRLVLFLAFRVRVSKKSILNWTKKYLKDLPNVYAPVKKKVDRFLLIVHADEKFFKIKGEWAY